MPDDEENLEEIIRRPARRDGAAPRPSFGTETLGRCDCGARITAGDVYGERGGADLGGPRRLAVRLIQYRCPLCGHLGELLVDG
jgi:hypothetical protein